MGRKLFLVFLILLNAGCAATRITSFKDPAFAETKIDRVLVVTPSADLEARTTAIETAFETRFADHAIKATPSFKIFMPTRKYTEEEIRKSIKENHFTAVLCIEQKDNTSDKVFLPGSGFGFTNGQISSPQAYSTSPNVHVIPGRQTFSAQSFSMGGGGVGKRGRCPFHSVLLAASIPLIAMATPVVPTPTWRAISAIEIPNSR